MTAALLNTVLRYIIKSKIISRFFNELIDHGEFLEKRSIHKNKLKLEYNFLNSVPSEIKNYFPAVHSYEEKADYSCYFIKKIHVPDASFLLINSNPSSEATIITLLEKLDVYLNQCPKKECHGNDFLEAVEREILQKNVERLAMIEEISIIDDLNTYCRHFGFASLREYILSLNDSIQKALRVENHKHLFFSHGDLCFSNLLLEGENLFLIDPKGAEHPEHNYRPVHYELAKISQSLLGSYDLITHGLFSITPDFKISLKHDLDINHARKKFEQMIIKKNSTLKNVRLVEASLFASLLPFHQDSEIRMKGFLLSSLNLYQELK